MRDKKGCHERGLLRREAHPVLLSNKQGSIRRLISLNKETKTRRVDKQIWSLGRTRTHWRLSSRTSWTWVIDSPHACGSGRRCEHQTTGGLPHFSKSSSKAPSLNEVMKRDGSSTLVLCGDVRKAFLRTGIKEQERDALRSHWRLHEGRGNWTYRFTRALFGLSCSPFLLWGSYSRVFASLGERDAGNCRGITQQPVRRWSMEVTLLIKPEEGRVELSWLEISDISRC